MKQETINLFQARPLNCISAWYISEYFNEDQKAEIRQAIKSGECEITKPNKLVFLKINNKH